MNNLQELKKSIFADGVIDEADITLLRGVIFDEEGVSRKKADFLFEIKDAIGKKKLTAELEVVFVEAITAYLLDDEDSPGEIDESEAKWLRAKIQYKGYVDHIDKRLLANLRKRSINFPEILNYKNKPVKAFEGMLFGLRFVTFLAVIGSMCASVVLFIRSSMQIYEGLKIFVFNFNSSESHELEHLVAQFVSSIDGYLFAMILIIFSMGIYELFINKIDPVEKALDARPSWLQINSIDDLKSSLGKVILMILIVSFFEHSLNIHYEGIKDLLFLGIGILLISAALYLTHIDGKHEHKSKSK
ncbi:MAG: YqhA family protein [Tannerella sp.]|jgi:uncharacterized membrane protein YqhA|nr:YqhA family protein [Tannerella sp.]